MTHPSIRAVGFTGSLQAGRALFDAAAARPDPIPVFAEMGSVNPVIVLPEAARDRAAEIARDLVASVTLGSGQFCTNPGLLFGIAGDGLAVLTAGIADAVEATGPQVLVHEGIRRGFDAGVGRWTGTEGVRRIGAGAESEAHEAVTARAAVFATDVATFTHRTHLHEEVFGPVSLLIEARDEQDLTDAVLQLDGNLTATLYATPGDLERHGALVRLLTRRVGRIILNGVPTGVEVCPSMHHGGPWPATTDVRSTSVGTAAIFRFARPICYQNFPDAVLPTELRTDNPAGILRMVDGRMTRDPL